MRRRASRDQEPVRTHSGREERNPPLRDRHHSRGVITPHTSHQHGGKPMTICWHGTRLYAFYSRDVGKFGGRAKHATIKIYDGSNAASPLTTISGELAKKPDMRIKGESS